MSSSGRYEAAPRFKQVNTAPRNYNNPEPLNVSLLGKSVTISLINNRVESGILRALGQYTLSIGIQGNRTLIVNKSAIITVVVNEISK
jgi:sRNA-binding regulator protein Hfq